MKKDPLFKLRVFDRLEVGPVRLEPRRLTAPYIVHRKGGSEATELIFRYEQDVFEPGERHSANLAAMAAAQVALNYGLFCDRIVFHGPFDRSDRKFLEEMARNTAREIYVKKLLEPNPFIKGQTPLVKRDSYLRARLVFADETSSQDPQPVPWRVGADRHAVLSSGGKDSLVSFGVLREVGGEPHAVFINESGRHWFTALNAHRHFSAEVPNTHRVWTNADRVFAWMLGHLPFVRRDFMKLRSDEYPIRLWTVAVFVFGALPLLRKHGIGRLVIGDEYDTTRRASHRGVAHYDGLYDQSRFFDNALTRYYQRKRWRVSQFSLLRPLSELLVQKILTERFPQLFRQQVSCHAAHVQGERVLPCGTCEKCRRIVGMLKALDADAKQCGYTADQIRRCLKQLAAKGVHQETAGAQQLGWMLHQKGVVPELRLGEVRVRERPEVMKLRFDAERSPLNTLPVDLREPVVRLLLEHADGTVRRSGRVWIDFDPLAEPALHRPYDFVARTREAKVASFSSEEGKNYLLSELTWPEAERRLKEVDVALLPVGATEQHGPHLPLDTDAFDADHLAKQVAAACSDPRPLVLPPIPYGVSYHHEDFPGTLSVSPDTLSRLVYDVGMSAARHGITKLVIVNGHAGNTPALKFAAQMVNRDAHVFACVESGETSDADILAATETPNDVHAGEVETSTCLATRPRLVKMGEAKKFVPEFSSRYLDFSSKRSVEWYARTAKISKSGVLGDPTRASREKGEKFWEIMIRSLVEFVEDIKGMSLDEIYQKRY
jgi:creatinine amidohydrolase/Fe(II)-dependent formamide hydrolase-like protein